MSKDDIVYIRHISDSIKWIDDYLKNIDSYDKFSNEHLIQDGVIRQLEIIGELSRISQMNLL